jgi:hypothetical protein
VIIVHADSIWLVAMRCSLPQMRESDATAMRLQFVL